MSGRAAWAAKYPASTDANAAMSSAGGTTSSGAGPPSACRLGSQAARSNRGFPVQAKFQSTSSARPSRRHRLSLRTSMCRSASPSITAECAAVGERGEVALRSTPLRRARARGTHRGRRPPRATPSGRTGSASTGGISAEGSVAATSPNVRTTASTRSRSHGGGQWASLRSSSTSTGRSPSSDQPSISGGEGQTPVLGVEEVLVADPRRGVQGERDLHERGRTVGQRRHPARGRGLATPGHRAPRHRFHTERALRALQVLGLGPLVHDAAAYRPAGTIWRRTR